MPGFFLIKLPHTAFSDLGQSQDKDESNTKDACINAVIAMK